MPHAYAQRHETWQAGWQHHGRRMTMAGVITCLGETGKYIQYGVRGPICCVGTARAGCKGVLGKGPMQHCGSSRTSTTCTVGEVPELPAICSSSERNAPQSPLPPRPGNETHRGQGECAPRPAKRRPTLLELTSPVLVLCVRISEWASGLVIWFLRRGTDILLHCNLGQLYKRPQYPQITPPLRCVSG